MIEANVHRFSKLERVHSGRAAAGVVAEEVAAAGAERVVIVTNRSLEREAAYLDGIRAALGPRHTGTFAGCRAHVPYEDVLECARAVRAARADLLVAVGGGSVADAAKMTLLACWFGLDDTPAIQARRGLGIDPSRWPDQPAGRALRMIAVPTTLSAGELNWGASATDTARGVKDIYGHALMVPLAVILDPAATCTAPDALLLATGMKALDHAAERWCASRTTLFSDAVSAEALRVLPQMLRRIRADTRDLEARHLAQTAMFLSSAGAASGVAVGASHGIGHVLGARGVPHGITACVLLPAVMRWNEAVNADRQRAMAALMGAAGRSGGDAIEALIRDLGLPTRLRDVGVAENTLADIAEHALDEGPVKRNPRPITCAGDVEAILRLAW